MKKAIKRILSLALTALMSVAVLAGCGGGGDGGEEDAGGKIKITVSVNGSDAAEGALMQKWKQAYEAKNPNVTIAVKSFNTEYANAIMSYMRSEKNMPDIMWTTGELHSKYSEEGVFVNMKDMIAGDSSIDLSDFYEASVSATHKNSQDDGVYFMPRDYNKCVLFINKVMFRAAGFSEEEIAGLKDGWDYDKFIETCQRLREAMDSEVNGLKASWVPVDARMDFNAVYCSFVKHYGGEFVEDDKVDFLSEKNLNAYGQIFELIDKNYIAEYGEKGSTTFASYRAAMGINVRPSLPNMPNNNNYDIDFLPLPLDHVGVGCSGYAITYIAKDRVSSSEFNTEKKTNQDYAFDFLKFIVSEEGQKIGAETGSIIPVRTDMYNDASWTAYMSADINHEAFISSPEKDFSTSIFQDFSTKDAAILWSSIANVMGQVTMGANYPEGYKLSGYAKLKDAIQPYQNSVANLRAVF